MTAETTTPAAVDCRGARRPAPGIDGAIRPAGELQRGVILFICGYGC